jgi:hypothetical protein
MRPRAQWTGDGLLPRSLRLQCSRADIPAGPCMASYPGAGAGRPMVSAAQRGPAADRSAGGSRADAVSAARDRNGAAALGPRAGGDSHLRGTDHGAPHVSPGGPWGSRRSRRAAASLAPATSGAAGRRHCETADSDVVQEGPQTGIRPHRDPHEGLERRGWACPRAAPAPRTGATALHARRAAPTPLLLPALPEEHATARPWPVANVDDHVGNH